MSSHAEEQVPHMIAPHCAADMDHANRMEHAHALAVITAMIAAFQSHYWIDASL